MFLLALPHNLISNRINVFPVLSHNNIKKGQKMVQVCMKILENVSDKEKKQTECTKKLSFHWPCFYGETHQQQYFYLKDVVNVETVHFEEDF